MDEYSQLGTTGLVSPLTKSLLGVQKKKRTSERDRRESKQKRQKNEPKQKDEQDQIMLSRKGDRPKSVSRSDDEVPGEYGTAKPKQRVSKKVDLVI
jgi:hypothetical protein